ncbi:MAG: sbcD, partial [Clostridiales bacterium]|nr:sbcD [Clostridiales bacterium]
RDDTINLVLSHIFINGGKESESERVLQVGGALTVEPFALPEKAHYVALGHLHRPQAVKNAPCPAYYSGSPLAYSFSEADYSKQIYIIEAHPESEPNIEAVLLNCGKPLRRWSAKNGLEEALRWCEEGRDLNAWIDLEVFTDRPITMEEQKKLRELNPGILNIRPILTTDINREYSFENRESKRIDELFREFYSYKTGMNVSDELIDTFLEIMNDQEEQESLDDGGDEIETKIS